MLKIQSSLLNGLSPHQLAILKTCCHLIFSIHHTMVVIWFATFDVAGLGNKNFSDSLINADRYISLWNFGNQLVYFCFALYCDYLELNPPPGSEEKQMKLKRFKDVVFTSIIFPITMMVATVFWLIYIIDIEMIIPRDGEACVPRWIQHSIHSWIVPYAFLEILLEPRIRPTNETPNLITFNAYNIFYGVVFLGSYFYTGTWAYPFYKALSWFQRLMFAALLFYITVAFYYVGWHTNGLLWTKNKDVPFKNGTDVPFKNGTDVPFKNGTNVPFKNGKTPLTMENNNLVYNRTVSHKCD